jgi:riboflavin synthase
VFTGIVEELGTVRAVVDQGDSLRLTVEGPLVVSDAAVGDSLAVNGCCLTVVEHNDTEFIADVMRETLQKTVIGALRPGDPVNLERAVTAGTRLGGHVVQGHVDGVGWIAERQLSDNWTAVTFSVEPALARYLVPKGSVTVDGVSLTVVEVGPDSFTVSLIPETLARTTLGIKQAGQPVNVEVDVIAKYVERLVAPHQFGEAARAQGTEEDS